MKVRTSFITNSSSSSFCITNKSQDVLTLKDLMKDWKFRIQEYYEDEYQFRESYKNEEWGKEFLEKYPTFTDFYNQVLEDADKLYSAQLKPNESIELECGDHPLEDGYASLFIHNTWDYLSQDDTKNFDICFLESHH